MKDDALVVTCEFDAMVHPACVEAAVRADPGDREAAIMHREVCSGRNGEERG